VNQANLCTRAQRASLRSLVIAFVACSAMLVGHAAHAASALTISGSPASTVTVGSSYSFTPTTHDTNTGRTLSFAVANKPAWASFSSSTGRLSGTPTAASVGKYADVVIAVYDGLTSAVLPNFGITVQASGSTSPPSPGTGLKISGSPASTVTVGSSYSFTPTTTDSNSGRTLSFAVANKPAWASFSSSTGHLSGTPTAANVGKYADVVIAAYDGLTSAVLPNFGITVQASGSTTSSGSVKISGTPPASVTAGSAYRFQPSATDSAGRTVSFSVANKPSWATFSIASGLLSGTPTTSQTGTYANITISASDGQSSSALPPFSISVGTTQAATGSATLEWSDPTKNTNGSALTDLAGIHIYYGTSESAMNHEITVSSTSETSYTISGLAAGTWYFGATAYTTAGMQSALSEVGSKTIP
jgi:Putative Ig domain